MMDGILYPLWDIGLKVGYSVRSIEESVGLPRTTCNRRPRCWRRGSITGDEDLFKSTAKGGFGTSAWRDTKRKYMAARLADQAARHAKFGNSPTMQEPNIKNGCGGLRDHQNLLWMAYFKYRTRTLAEMQERELISEAERKQLEAAYDFLLRVRNELHYHTNRPVDVLSRISSRRWRTTWDSRTARRASGWRSSCASCTRTRATSI